MRALFSAATGMYAQQLKIDAIANNLANVNTDGYKKTSVRFEDLLYQNLNVPSTSASGAKGPSQRIQIGLGVKSSGSVRQFTQGPLKETGNRLDLAISGEGFLRVRLQNGEVAYTRNGSLKIDEDGRLMTLKGYLIDPPVTFPTDSNPDLVSIDADGMITGISTRDRRVLNIGEIIISRPRASNILEAIGENLYRAPVGRRLMEDGQPAMDGFGSLQQGYIESSNVKVVEEMIAMISSQRAYEASSKVIETADRMLEEANRIR